MPIRQTVPKRASEKIIEELRAAIRAGAPWHPSERHGTGYGDLIFLVTGLFYGCACNFIRSSHDLDTAKELWWNLREDIVEQHIKQEPGSRPWAWWSLEDREPRRRLSKHCACPPALEHYAKLPPASLSWFGKPRGCGCPYEDEADYLDRLGLLTRGSGGLCKLIR